MFLRIDKLHVVHDGTGCAIEYNRDCHQLSTAILHVVPIVAVS